jgi:hypothetical protein
VPVASASRAWESRSIAPPLRIVLGAVLGAVLLAAAADATASVTIGSGHKPGLAVDAAGTAYIAWYGPEPGTTKLQFCRLPRGAAACDVSHPIATPGTSLSRPFVTVQGSTVRVASYRYGLSSPRFDQVWEFTSADRGASFDAGHEIGIVPFDEAILGPGNTVSVASNAVTAGGLFQNMPLGGGSAGTSHAVFPADHPYNGTVGLIDANTPLVVFADGASRAQARRYSGLGSLNDAASWSGPADIGYADYPRLASGPRGLFVLAGTQANALVVRRWDGTTFTPGTTISDGADDAQAHLTEDPGGRLHAVFPRGAADGLHLYHAVSDDGVSWRSGSVLIQTGAIGIGGLRAAAAADHVGVAVWDANAQIRTVAIGPDAPAATPPTTGPSPPPAGPPPPTRTEPVPKFHETVVVRRISGKVLLRVPGSRRFVELADAQAIPLRSTVNVKKGVLSLTSVPKPAGTPETARFFKGIFRVTQPGSITQLALTERLAACRRATTAAKRPRRRKLWGDGAGAFRTRGRYSAATVRGTRWLVQDSCAGTRTRVARGIVTVRDRVRRKTIVLRAGKRYLARPPR